MIRSRAAASADDCVGADGCTPPALPRQGEGKGGGRNWANLILVVTHKQVIHAFGLGRTNPHPGPPPGRGRVWEGVETGQA